MCSFFNPSEPEPIPSIEPVSTNFPKIVGAEIAAATYGQRIAGDFYESLRVGPERILFGLLDVAGRRENNQVILTAAQEMFKAVAGELFSKADFNEAEAMTELCLRLNRSLMEAAQGVISCPAFMGCYHEKFGTLCYINAGHTPGLLRDSTGTTELASTGLPLGLFSHATCDAPTVGLERGAVLLLVSRGVVENKSNGDQDEDSEYGLKRIKQQFTESVSRDAQALAASVLNAAGESTNESEGAQGMTALVLVRTQ
jgi:serine phosphatase RsbU (regulator of sigma subunit)